jgi:hypothetical protein
MIKDYRDKEGVYYEAKCDHCGRIYYPKRSTSKYCSKTCTIEQAKGNTLDRGGSIDDKKPQIKRERSEVLQRALDISEKIKKKYKKL